LGMLMRSLVFLEFSFENERNTAYFSHFCFRNDVFTWYVCDFESSMTSKLRRCVVLDGESRADHVGEGCGEQKSLGDQVCAAFGGRSCMKTQFRGHVVLCHELDI